VSATGIPVSCTNAKSDKNTHRYPSQKAQQGQKKRPHEISFAKQRSDITLPEQMPDRAF
jgi:hypothetical protein